MSSSERLNEYLFPAVCDSSMLLGWSGPSFQKLRTAVRLVDSLKQAARSVIETTNASVANRDHITRLRLDILQRALED